MFQSCESLVPEAGLQVADGKWEMGRPSSCLVAHTACQHDNDMLSANITCDQIASDMSFGLTTARMKPATPCSAARCRSQPDGCSRRRLTHVVTRSPHLQERPTSRLRRLKRILSLPVPYAASGSQRHTRGAAHAKEAHQLPSRIRTNDLGPGFTAVSFVRGLLVEGTACGGSRPWWRPRWLRA